jgi:exopolysaccharide biosynthesis polyprenyl glycosylphosphotransferase
VFKTSLDNARESVAPSPAARRLAVASRATEAEPLPRLNAPDSVLARDATYRRLLAMSDITAVLVAVLVVTAIGHTRLTPAFILALPLIVLVAKVQGLYDRDDLLIRKGTLDETPSLFQLATVFALLTWIASPLYAAGEVGRLETLGLWLTLFAALIVCRTLGRGLAGLLADEERCLFVGDDAAAERFDEKLRSACPGRASLVARMSLQEAGLLRAADASSGRLAEIQRSIRDLDVHRAVISPGAVDSEEVHDLVRTLKALGVRVSLVPRMFEVVGSSVAFDELEGTTLLGVRRFDLTRSSQRLKRSFDLLGAATGLLVLAPVMIGAAALIRLTSRGPVFFRQIRIGRDGRQFRMFKFRTMVHDAEAQKAALVHRNEGADGFFKIPGDPRITRVGSFLRCISLDELPQLFNVLRGEMSLVGPRPLVAEEDDQIEGWYRRRLELTPGMTGHWQILGSSRVPLREMVAIDYLYAANWSLWTDVKIVLRTVSVVLGRRGL